MGDPVDQAIEWLVGSLASGTSPEEVEGRVVERLRAGGRLALAFNKDPRFAAWRSSAPVVEAVDRPEPLAAQVTVRAGAELWELRVVVDPRPPHLIRSFVPRLVPQDGLTWAEVGATLGSLPARSALSPSTAAPEVSAAIHDRLLRLRDDHQVVGLATAVVVGGRLVHEELLGVESLDGMRPVTPASRFAVGSCTKLPTALAVLALAAAGRLDLDAPVDEYLTTPVLLPSGSAAPTVTDLLLHRAGVPREVDAAAAARLVAGDRLPDVVPTVRLAAPGRVPSYSNLGYELLGAMVEEITGELHADVVEHELAGRYGMTSSILRRPGRPAPTDVSGYRAVGGFLTGTDAERPWCAAGGMSSTLTDMTALATALAGDTDPLMRSARAITAPAGTHARFAAGFALQDRDGRTVAWRAGGVDGFTADIRAWPGSGDAVVFLTNKSPADSYSEVGAELLSLAG